MPRFILIAMVMIYIKQMLAMVTSFFIYIFLKISTMVEMHEIITHGEFLIIRIEVSDRGEDLFLYYMRKLI